MVPAHDDVQRALQGAHISMNAQVTPALSSKRCVYLLHWLMHAFGAEHFAQPVDWRKMGLFDYPRIVPHPMDMNTLRKWTGSEDFRFCRFIDLARLMWANACAFNPHPHPLHSITLQLASLFDERVIQMQKEPDDQCIVRLSHSYGTINNTILLTDRFEIFRNPVNLEHAVDYEHHVICPMCFKHIDIMLAANLYVSKHDLETDWRQIIDNAIAFNGPTHAIGILAKELQATLARLLISRDGEKHLITSEMRMQLLNDIKALSNSSRIEILKFIATCCSDAVEENSDVSGLIVDALSNKEFVKIHMRIRKLKGDASR